MGCSNATSYVFSFSLTPPSTDLSLCSQESYSTEEALNPTANFDPQKNARIEELEALLDVHKREISSLTEQVAHWRGLVERYGGSTTEILDLEERERREKDKSEGAEAVSRSLAEQLRLNEELKQGASLQPPPLTDAN